MALQLKCHLIEYIYIHGIQIGNQIYWTFLQLVTTRYRSLSYNDQFLRHRFHCTTWLRFPTADVPLFSGSSPNIYHQPHSFLIPVLALPADSPRTHFYWHLVLVIQPRHRKLCFQHPFPFCFCVCCDHHVTASSHGAGCFLSRSIATAVSTGFIILSFSGFATIM